MPISDELHRALEIVANHMPEEADDWWIIGSAAIALSTDLDLTPNDVDIIASKSTLLRFLSSLSEIPKPSSPNEQFSSDPYQRIDIEDATPIEVMGDLRTRNRDGTWQKLEIKTRLPLTLGNTAVFVPGVAEQIEILKRFGRDKDLKKAAMLGAERS